MSVLFKALQKAEKDNEQRQAASGGTGFDAGRLAGSGAIRFAGGRGLNWRIIGLGAVGILAVGIVAAVVLVDTPPSSPVRTAAVAQPATATQISVTQVKPGTSEAIPIMRPLQAAPVAATPQAAQQQQLAQAPATTAPAAQSATTPVPQVAAPQQIAEAPAVADTEPAPPQVEPAAMEPKLAAPAQRPAANISVAPARPERMPDLAVNSPARMLNPPIAIQRAEFELSGVGNAVHVREVSQGAQNNVSAGYNALVRGSYDTALGFYDRALQEEPQSVLALLGRGAALQKLGRMEEARAAYERVLKADPTNREALSNLTVILAERAPAEALTKLLDLEKEYPSFSPIKAQIGLTYAKVGSMTEAYDYLNRATAMSPESVMYQYNMALVLDHLGRSDQAVSAYEIVLASISSGRAAPELSSNEIERRVRFLKTR